MRRLTIITAICLLIVACQSHKEAMTVNYYIDESSMRVDFIPVDKAFSDFSGFNTDTINTGNTQYINDLFNDIKGLGLLNEEHDTVYIIEYYYQLGYTIRFNYYIKTNSGEVHATPTCSADKKDPDINKKRYKYDFTNDKPWRFKINPATTGLFKDCIITHPNEIFLSLVYGWKIAELQEFLKHARCESWSLTINQFVISDGKAVEWQRVYIPEYPAQIDTEYEKTIIESIKTGEIPEFKE